MPTDSGQEAAVQNEQVRIAPAVESLSKPAEAEIPQTAVDQAAEQKPAVLTSAQIVENAKALLKSHPLPDNAPITQQAMWKSALDYKLISEPPTENNSDSLEHIIFALNDVLKSIDKNDPQAKKEAEKAEGTLKGLWENMEITIQDGEHPITYPRAQWAEMMKPGPNGELTEAQKILDGKSRLYSLKNSSEPGTQVEQAGAKPAEGQASAKPAETAGEVKKDSPDYLVDYAFKNWETLIKDSKMDKVKLEKLKQVIYIGQNANGESGIVLKLMVLRELSGLGVTELDGVKIADVLNRQDVTRANTEAGVKLVEFLMEKGFQGGELQEFAQALKEKNLQKILDKGWHFKIDGIGKKLFNRELTGQEIKDITDKVKAEHKIDWVKWEKIGALGLIASIILMFMGMTELIGAFIPKNQGQ